MYSCKALNENPNRWKWNITNVWNTMIFQVAGISVLPQEVVKGLPSVGDKLLVSGMVFSAVSFILAYTLASMVINTLVYSSNASNNKCHGQQASTM